MPNNAWSAEDSDFSAPSAVELDPISSFISELTDPDNEEEEFKSDFFQGLAGRRRKAAFLLMTICTIVIALHSVSWGYWVVLGFTGLLSIQAIRLVTVKPEIKPEPLSSQTLVNAPTVSLIVAAKNEQSVIGNLVKMLANLDYPHDRYEVWVINDASIDRTPEILDSLALEYPCLKVLHRKPGSLGGKSGALNEVLPLTFGEIIGVFDADAGVTKDLLKEVVSLFADPKTGAVQVRKAIANAGVNFWTKGQAAEMILDSYFQQQRIALGGIGELRGNGQFVLRRALEHCGGWNEETITDDLDLTIRLHLDGWKINFLNFPAVKEEGVTKAISLWHQRSRWAEGGYQRYLDYWRLILKQPMGLGKKIDLVSFILIQYILPTAAIPDLVMAIAKFHLPILSPLTALMFCLSFWGMLQGLIRTRNSKNNLNFKNLAIMLWQTIRGFIYMLHWLVVMPITTARMSIRPKRLKWVKTVHEGTQAVIGV
jgi:1,2-diacylglycerol 3-beta-glucosyltransferase